MEFVVELIVGFFCEVLGFAITESKLKTWIKTIIWTVLAQAMTALFVVLSVLTIQDGNSGGYVVAVIAVLWFVFSVIGTISGHRRKWKQTDR